MWEYNYSVNSADLYHHGVKGMKWGVRRNRKTSGNLTNREIKKYAKKGYAKDAYNRNKSSAGKIYDKVTGAHKINADITYNMSSKKKNKARAEKYLKDKQKYKNMPLKQKAARKVAKGASIAAKSGKKTLAQVAHYQQTKHTMNAVGNALRGDFGGFSASLYYSSLYGRAEEYLRD